MNNFSLIYFIYRKIIITLQPFVEEEGENKFFELPLNFNESILIAQGF